MAAAPDVANGIHPAQGVGKPALQAGLVGGDPCQQVVAGDDLLHRDPGGAGGGVAGKGVAGAKGAVLVVNRLPHGAGADRRPQRQIAPRQTLGHRHDVGRDPVACQRAPRTGAPGAAHHLVGDHQHAVTAANLAHLGSIAVRCRHAAPRRPDHRLKDEGRHRFGARRQNGRLKLGCAGRTHGFGAGTGDRAVCIGRGQLDRGDEGPLISHGALGKARHAQRAQRIAVP